jgi:hypothetical protein
VTKGVCGEQARALLPRLPGIAEKRFSVVLPHPNGGARDETPGARAGASGPVTVKCPVPQCAQTRHSKRATRRMNCAIWTKNCCNAR